MRRAVAVLAMFTLTSSLLVSQAPAYAAAGCDDYAFVGARGSGELSEAEDPGNQGLGEPLQAVYAQLEVITERSGRTIHAEGLDYPAVSIQGKDSINAIGKLLHVTKTFDDSVSAGGNATIAAVRKLNANCPATSVILAGYSQGAMAIQEGIKQARNDDASNVVGGFFFGDPQFNPKSSGETFGSFDPEHSGVFGPHDSWASMGLQNPTSVCHYADPICNSVAEVTIGGVKVWYRDVKFLANAAKASGNSDYFLPHTNYQDEARRSAAMMAERIGIPGVNPFETLPTANIIFATDVWDYRDDYALADEQFDQMRSELLTKNPNTCFGTMPYYKYKNRNFGKFVDNTTFSSWSCLGGAIAPIEPGFDPAHFEIGRISSPKLVNEAIGDLLNEQKYFPTGKTTLVLLSSQAIDENGGTFSDDYGIEHDAPSRDAIIEQAKRQDMTIVAGSLNNNLTAPRDASPRRTAASASAVAEAPNADLAQATGGDYAAGGQQITSLTERGLKYDAIALSARGSTEVGEEAAINVAGAIDLPNGSSVEWTFDDGTLETTTSATVRHVFTSPGDHVVRAILKRPNAFDYRANVTVHVDQAASTAPDTPTVTLSSRGSQVTAEWAAVTGALGYQILDENGEVLDSFAALAEPSVSWTIPDATLGSETTLQVRSFNRTGFSAASPAATVVPEAPTAIRVRSDLAGGSSTVDLDEDVVIDGDFSCDDEGFYRGNVRVTGNAIISSHCQVNGDVFAGGNITLNGSAYLGGSIYSAGSVHLSDGVQVAGDIDAVGVVRSDGSTDIADLVQGQVTAGVEMREPLFVPARQPVQVPSTAATWSERGGSGCSASPSADELEMWISLEGLKTVDATACSALSVQSAYIYIDRDVILYVDDASFDSVHVAGSGSLTIVSSEGQVGMQQVSADSAVELHLNAHVVTQLIDVSRLRTLDADSVDSELSIAM